MISRLFSKLGFAAASAAMMTTTAFATDLTVDYGQSVTIDANATYDTVTVNGDLVVVQGVTLTATKFFVGYNNNNNRATVTLQNNAKITMPSWDGADSDARCHIAYSSPATLTMLTNSVFTTSDIRIGQGKQFNTLADIPPKLMLHNPSISFIVSNEGKVDFQTRANNDTGSTRSYDKSQPLALLELNGAGSVVSPRCICLANGDMTIRFAGGRVLFDKRYNWGQSQLVRVGTWAATPATLSLESVDGAPIRFDVKSAVEGNKAWALFGGMKHATDTITTSGMGAFQMEGDAKFGPLFKSDNGSITLGHTGGFRVLGGACMMLDQFSSTAISAMANGVNDLVMEAGSLVDLNGANSSFDAVASAGTITNTSATVPTLTIGANGGDAVFGIAPSVPVVKTGAGVLRVPDGALDSVSVQGGTIDLCDRASVGFPYYRFWVKAPRGNIRLSEFALYDGADDVTAHRSAISEVTEGGWHNDPPSNLADGDFSTRWDNRCLGGTSNWRTNNVYFVVHYGNAPSFKHSFPADPGEADKSAVMYANSAYIASASPMQPVTAYTFAYADKTEVAPSEWVFQGAMKGNEWRDLDHVTGYNAAGGTASSWCGTNFVANCGVSEVSVDSLTVGDNATWAIDMDQADIDVGTLTAGQNVQIVLSGVQRPHKNFTLPVAVSNLSGSIASWSIAFAEHPGVVRGVCLDNGFLATIPEATVLYLR